MVLMNEEEQKGFNKRYLDTLDLKKYVKDYTNIFTIFNNIAKDFNKSERLPYELNGRIFKYLDKCDICEYLEKRYYKNRMIKTIWGESVEFFETKPSLKNGTYVFFKSYNEIGKIQYCENPKEKIFSVLLHGCSWREECSIDELLLATDEEIKKYKLHWEDSICFPEYKGYTADVKYDEDYNCYHGIVTGIKDCVEFFADKKEEIEEKFHEEIEEYLDFSKGLAEYWSLF